MAHQLATIQKYMNSSSTISVLINAHQTLVVPSDLLNSIGDFFESFCSFDSQKLLAPPSPPLNGSRTLGTSIDLTDLSDHLISKDAVANLIAYCMLNTPQDTSKTPSTKLSITFSLPDLVSLLFLSDYLQFKPHIYTIIESQLKQQISTLPKCIDFLNLCKSQFEKWRLSIDQIIAFSKLDIQTAVTTKVGLPILYNTCYCHACRTTIEPSKNGKCSNCHYFIFCQSCYNTSSSFCFLDDHYQCFSCRRKQTISFWNTTETTTHLSVFTSLFPALWLSVENEYGTHVDYLDFKRKLGITRIDIPADIRRHANEKKIMRQILPYIDILNAFQGHSDSWY